MVDEREIPELSYGSHDSPEDGMCVMEAVAFVAGEPFSDDPACACPVIAAFLRAWNDGLPDEERDALLRPLIPRLLSTRATPEIEQRRAVMAADWLIRTHTPAWLRMAGLTAQADEMAALPAISDFAQCPSLMLILDAARRDTIAARAAAWDAARGAAVAAAWGAVVDDVVDAAVASVVDDAVAAAKASAVDAAVAAAVDAAVAASVDAAKAAVVDAAVAKLNPTRLELQRSALDLVERMIAVA